MGIVDKIRASIGGSRGGRAAESEGQGNDAPELPTSTRGSEAEILAALIRYVVEREDQELRAEDVDPTANIFDYGYVDSLEILSFLNFIEQHFGVHILDEDLVARFETLESLARHIADSPAGRERGALGSPG